MRDEGTRTEGESLWGGATDLSGGGRLGGFLELQGAWRLVASEKTSSVVLEGSELSSQGIDARKPPNCYPQAGAGRHQFLGFTGGGPTAAPITVQQRDRGVDKPGKVTTRWKENAGQEAPAQPGWKSQIPTLPGPFEVPGIGHQYQRNGLKPS